MEAYRVSKSVEDSQTSTGDKRHKLATINTPTDLRIHDNPLYEALNDVHGRQTFTGDLQYDTPYAGKTQNDICKTETSQRELKNTKPSLVIVVALSAAVLALVVTVVCVGLTTVLNYNYNSETQSRTAEMENIQLKLNTAIKSKFEIQAVVNNLKLSLNESVNTIDILGHQISTLQADKAAEYGIFNETVKSLQNTTRQHADFINKLNFKGSIANPAKSCSEIPTDRPSGEYWILRNSSSVQVYCHMNRTGCNTTGGWMRVANLDMADPNQQCPNGYILVNRTTAPRRTCARYRSWGCLSTTLPVHGFEYSRVCGSVIGYQYGSGNAFSPYHYNHNITIDDLYVFGFSLTHGQLPRKHIWTFAAAEDEFENTPNRFTCPCTRSDIPYTLAVPPFIGQDYFCDTGSRNDQEFIFYPDDPLWNGQGCGGNSTCCSFNNPPWFCKQLPQPTTDDIELRGCLNFGIGYVNIYIELIDIFVQ